VCENGVLLSNGERAGGGTGGEIGRGGGGGDGGRSCEIKTNFT